MDGPSILTTTGFSIMSSAAGEQICHILVDYLLTPSRKFEEISPAKFRVGDIVQAQLSFIAVPTKRNKHMMRLVLRAISILDSSITNVRYILNELRQLLNKLTESYCTSSYPAAPQQEEARGV